MEIRKWHYTQEEDDLIMAISKKHGSIGKQLEKIAKKLGRTPAAVKFRYATLNSHKPKEIKLSPKWTERKIVKTFDIDDALDAIKAHVNDSVRQAESKYVELENENAQLKAQLRELQAEFDQVLGIINKARQIQTGVVGSSMSYRQNRDGSIDTI